MNRSSNTFSLRTGESKLVRKPTIAVVDAMVAAADAAFPRDSWQAAPQLEA